jgi:hypothetical protein
MAAVLAAPVRMKDQARTSLSAPDRHDQGIYNQLFGHAFVNCPTNHFSGIEIHDDRKV